MRTPGAFDQPTNAVRVHHALAEPAGDYTKKQFVFRLATSDQAEYLFQVRRIPIFNRSYDHIIK